VGDKILRVFKVSLTSFRRSWEELTLAAGPCG
jgi:hypothetical protein